MHGNEKTTQSKIGYNLIKKVIIMKGRQSEGVTLFTNSVAQY